MPRLARLWTDLELESSQFSVGLRKAVNDASKASTSIQRSLSALKGGLVAAAGTIASMGLLSAARDALDYASAIEETSQQLGVTTRDLQAYRYAATQAGVSQETMEKALQKLTRTMGEARAGSKAQAAAFRELNGVIGKDILASATTAGDAIPLIADALAEIPDAGRRARLEVALFGRAGQQLEPLLTQGSKGVNALRSAAESLGIVLSDRQIQDADKTADKLAELNLALSANIAGVIADNAAEIYGLVDALTALIGKVPETISALNRMRYQAAENVSKTVELYALGSGSPRLAADAQRSQRFANANIRQIDARTRVDAAAKKLERSGFVVPRDKNGNVVESQIRRATVPRSSPSSGTPAASAGRSRGGSGRSAADEAERTRLWYEVQIARSKLEELSVHDQIIGSYRTRYALEMERIEQDRAAFARDLTEQKGLSAVQREQLTLANERALDLRTQLADNDRTAGLAREEYELASQINDLAQDVVRSDIDRARTAADRRDAELRLLALQKQAEAAQIELVLATESTASAAWQNAKRRREALDGQYDARADAVRRDTMGPLARFLDDMPRSAREMDEAFQQVAVRGLDDFTDSLMDAVRGTKSLKDAFTDMANGIVADLLRIQLRKMLVDGIGSLFGLGGASVSTDVGFYSGLTNSALDGIKLPRMAGGGALMVGGNPGIDRNVLSINGRPRALVSANERVDVSPPKAANERGLALIVSPSPYFTVAVDQRAGRVVAGAAPAMMSGGASTARIMQQRANGRRLA